MCDIAGLIKLHTGGSGNGYVITPILTTSFGLAAGIQADGKIVAAGYAQPGNYFALARYHAEPAYVGTLFKIIKMRNT